MKGLTQRQLMKWAARLKDLATVEIQKGKTGAGIIQWQTASPNPINCWYQEKSRTAYGSRGPVQAYDGEVLVASGQALQTEGKRVHLTITIYQSEHEMTEDPPAAKRTAVVDVVNSEMIRDHGGHDAFQLLRVTNGQ